MKKLSVLSVLLIQVMLSSATQAGEYTCSIKNTLKMSANGYFVTHGWAANYKNREFTVDSETGRVLRTTALKQRLSNADDKSGPVILNPKSSEAGLKVFTHFEENGGYALLHVYAGDEFADKSRKPFFYHTDVGLILTGTCVLSE